MNKPTLKQSQMPAGVTRGMWDYAQSENIANTYDEYFEHHKLLKLDHRLVQDALTPYDSALIADLGCGTGRALVPLVRAGARGLAVDLSEHMLCEVRSKSDREHLSIECLLANLVDLDCLTTNSVDHAICLFSTLGMIQGQPNRCQFVRHVRRIIKPGGRFVAEFGGRGNVKAIVGAIYNAIEALGYPSKREFNPWYLPSVGEYATLLERQGFGVNYAAFFYRPTSLEGGDGGIHNWIDMFAGDFLIGIPVGKRTDVIQNVENQLRPNLYRDGTWFADYRRIRVFGVKEQEQPARIK